jgi:hypothetical protein
MSELKRCSNGESEKPQASCGTLVRYDIRWMQLKTVEKDDGFWVPYEKMLEAYGGTPEQVRALIKYCQKESKASCGSGYEIMGVHCELCGLYIMCKLLKSLKGDKK